MQFLKHVSWLLLLCAALVFSASAQDGRVKGRVLDVDGKPMSGVTVRLKGQSIAVATDDNGEFSIPGAQKNSILVFSYIGYTEKETTVTDVDASLSVNLHRAGTDLDDVVVVGYGTAKKKELVGATAVVKAKDAGATTTTNPSQLLIGKVTGVQVIQNSGAPGEDAQIIVRGTGSFTNVDPLYVVDGIQGDKNLFNTISPQDIEDITVLKDASSTAIYGAAAANGVVLITTKKGKIGAPRVTVSSQWGSEKVAKRYTLLNAAQYVEAIKDFAATNNTTLPDKFSTSDVLQDKTDWQDAIFRRAPVSQNNFSINGGSEKVIYGLSGGFITQKSVVQDQNFKRANFRLSLEETLGRFKFGQTVSFRYTQTDGVLAPISWALGQPPYKSILDASIEGGYSIVANDDDLVSLRNPIQHVRLNKSHVTEYILFPQVFGEVNLFKGLKFRSQVSAQVGSYKSNTFTIPYMSSNYSENPRAATEGLSTYSGYLLENYLSYNNSFGKHSIGLTLGNSYRDPGKSASLRASGSDIANDEIQYISVAKTKAVTGAGNNYNDVSLISYFARINYSFDNKYILSGSIRRDGASNFGANNRFGNFPGAGLAWRFSEEQFMQHLLPGLDEGKIRLGWGRTGNNNIPNFLTTPLTFAGTPAGNLVSAFGPSEVFKPGVTISTLDNPNLKWETTDQTNIGLDLSLLKKRLTFTFDWYNRKSSGLLVYVPIPTSTGIGLSDGGQSYKVINAADAQNKGVEFMLAYADRVGKDFTFNVSANIAFNKNKVLSLGSQFAAPITDGAFSNLSTFTYTAAGTPIGAFYGYRVDHVAKDDAEITALNKAAATSTGNVDAVFQDGLLAGDFIFKDLNHDGVVDENDQEVLGSPIPKVVYGFNLGANYKNFDLNLVVSGISGVSLVNAMKFNTMTMATAHNVSTDILNYWQQPGDVASLPRLGQSVTASGNLRASDWWVENGSYLRVRNITLGYSIPANVLNPVLKGTFKSVRFYVAGQNLLTITKYSGYDPEVSTMTDGSYTFTRGIDDGRIPLAKSFLVGLQLGF